MTDVVIDASALIELLLATEIGGAVGAELRRLECRVLHAPGHVVAEAVQGLRGIAMGQADLCGPCERAATHLSGLPMRLWDTRPLIARMWQLRANISAYDAAYPALAEVTALPLITTDRRLARAVLGSSRCEVLAL